MAKRYHGRSWMTKPTQDRRSVEGLAQTFGILSACKLGSMTGDIARHLCRGSNFQVDRQGPAREGLTTSGCCRLAGVRAARAIRHLPFAIWWPTTRGSGSHLASPALPHPAPGTGERLQATVVAAGREAVPCHGWLGRLRNRRLISGRTDLTDPRQLQLGSSRTGPGRHTLAFPAASSCVYTAGSCITRYCAHEKFRSQAAPGDAEGAEPDRDT